MALAARPLPRGAEELEEDVCGHTLLTGVLILNVTLMILPPLIALLVLAGLVR
jgi:hypothetical protein